MARTQKTITTGAFDDASLALVNYQRLGPFGRKLDSLSRRDLRGCVINMAFALQDVKRQLEREHGIRLDLRGESREVRQERRRITRKLEQQAAGVQ